jgi:predicted AAA+ superfamily ATPase
MVNNSPQHSRRLSGGSVALRRAPNRVVRVVRDLHRSARDPGHLEHPERDRPTAHLAFIGCAHFIDPQCLGGIASGWYLPHDLTRYLALLEATYLFWRLPAWSGNLGKRLLAHPKIVVTDCGVAAALQGIDESRLVADEHLAGPIFETFVAGELLNLSGWSQVRPSLFHFRSVAGDEVDLLLERRDGSVVGIEVRAGANVDNRDFRGLRVLAEGLGDKFRRGIVLYTGAHVLSFGPDLLAMPIGALWLR